MEYEHDITMIKYNKDKGQRYSLLLLHVFLMSKQILKNTLNYY